MDNTALDEADELLAGAREVAAAGRPSAAWADLLRARAIYEDLHRPWDVASVDVVLGGQNVLPVAEGHEAAWEQLLADVGWTPGAPAPLSNLKVRCLGEEHEVAITEDWRMLPVLSRGQRAEHVAAALVGEEPFCTTLGRKIDTVRAWAARSQRLRPWIVSWTEPDLERWEVPQLDRAGWASDGDEPSELPLPAGPVGELLGALPATHPSDTARRLAAPHVLGGGAAIDWLWRRGVHPDLARAIHAAVGVDEPIDPAAVARLVVRRVVHPVDRTGRVSGVREWSDDPLPVGCLVELLGDAVGERRLSMRRFLAAAGGARDADDPSRLLAWWDAHELPEQARVTLHRGGFERSDLTRWAKSWGGVAEIHLAQELQETPPGRWPLTVWTDLAGYLAQKHLEHAAVWQGIPRECEALRGPLEAAAASGDVGRILRAAAAIDRNHPNSDPARAACPVWITAGVQAMVALHPENPQSAAAVLAALRDHPRVARTKPRQPLLDEAEWIWVALERQAGRRVPLPPPSEESAELVFSLLEHRPAPPDVPKAQWLAHFGPVVDRVWGRLRMAGVTLEQAVRWQPAEPERWPEYVLWLADFQPYPLPVGQPPEDPIAWLIAEGRRRARGWAVAHHSRLHRQDTALEEQETLACLEDLRPALEAALAGNDHAQVDKAAREVLRGHTYYHAHKNYRYHLDSCPVDQLARLVLGVRAYPADRPDAWALLTGDRDDPDSDGVVEQRYTSALCMAAWLTLNLGEDRLVKDDHLAAKWKAAADRSVDGRWLLRVVLEAAASVS
jgi:hypothetical protein